MDTYSSYTETSGRYETVVAIGNFDGLHRGHRTLLQASKRFAKTEGLLWSVLTFSPHPAQVLAPDRAPAPLMTVQEKTAAFQQLGLEKVWFQSFSKAFADLTPEVFVQDVLEIGLGARHVVVGFDFCFGRNRSGNIRVLEQLLSQRGIGLTVIEPVANDDGKVSSSVIRRALGAGRIEEANALLGWSYSIVGPVIKGDARGRTIGFPTMNVALKNRLHPAAGVYAGWVFHQGVYHAAIANLGTQPTVGNTRPFLLEVHVPNIDLGSMYGCDIEFCFDSRLRDVQRFESLDALTEQIALDTSLALTRLDGRVPTRVSVL